MRSRSKRRVHFCVQSQEVLNGPDYRARDGARSLGSRYVVLSVVRSNVHLRISVLSTNTSLFNLLVLKTRREFSENTFSSFLFRHFATSAALTYQREYLHLQKADIPTLLPIHVGKSK